MWGTVRFGAKNVGVYLEGWWAAFGDGRVPYWRGGFGPGTYLPSGAVGCETYLRVWIAVPFGREWTYSGSRTFGID